MVAVSGIDVMNLREWSLLNKWVTGLKPPEDAKGKKLHEAALQIIADMLDGANDLDPEDVKAAFEHLLEHKPDSLTRQILETTLDRLDEAKEVGEESDEEEASEEEKEAEKDEKYVVPGENIRKRRRRLRKHPERRFPALPMKKPMKSKEETDEKGGPGSGHHGHSGIPGQRGGSAPGDGGSSGGGGGSSRYNNGKIDSRLHMLDNAAIALDDAEAEFPDELTPAEKSKLSKRAARFHSRAKDAVAALRAQIPNLPKSKQGAARRMTARLDAKVSKFRGKVSRGNWHALRSLSTIILDDAEIVADKFNSWNYEFLDKGVISMSEKANLSGRYSHNELYRLLSAAVREKFDQFNQHPRMPGGDMVGGMGYYIQDVFEDAIVVSENGTGKLYQIDYTITDGEVELADELIEVELQYVPVGDTEDEYEDDDDDDMEDSEEEADEKGGPGSGNFGHAGRVGERGGSAPGDGGGGGSSGGMSRAAAREYVRNLTDNFEGKPSNWREVPKIPKEIVADAEFQQAVSKLPKFTASELFGTKTSKISETIPGAKDKSTVFVLQIGEESYLVNTEGYDYMRYIARLKFLSGDVSKKVAVPPQVISVHFDTLHFNREAAEAWLVRHHFKSDNLLPTPDNLALVAVQNTLPEDSNREQRKVIKVADGVQLVLSKASLVTTSTETKAVVAEEKKFFHAELMLDKKAKEKDPEELLKSQKFHIQGWASTIDQDRGKDIVHAEAFKDTVEEYKENPILLYAHKPDRPIGTVEEIKIVPEKGLFVKANISRTEPEIRTKILEGVLRAFSFGFRPVEFEEERKDKEVIRHLKKVELFEVSVVPIPMNKRALFSVVKGMQLGSDLVCKAAACKETCQCEKGGDVHAEGEGRKEEGRQEVKRWELLREQVCVDVALLKASLEDAEISEEEKSAIQALVQEVTRLETLIASQQGLGEGSKSEDPASSPENSAAEDDIDLELVETAVVQLALSQQQSDMADLELAESVKAMKDNLL